MPKKRDMQMNAMQQLSALRGVQDFYKLKLGFKPQQYQVEQPSGFNNDTTPMYLQGSSTKNSN